MDDKKEGFGLCLSRRVGQSVTIAPGTPNECIVTVVEYDRRSGHIRLLFKAAPAVKILRSELVEKGGDV